jgi:hypothetical protein
MPDKIPVNGVPGVAMGSSTMDGVTVGGSTMGRVAVSRMAMGSMCVSAMTMTTMSAVSMSAMSMSTGDGWSCVEKCQTDRGRQCEQIRALHNKGPLVVLMVRH